MLHADKTRRIKAFEPKCITSLFRISYTEHKTIKTIEYVRNMTEAFVVPQEPLLETVKR
ncbi:hypothetical protein DPMN_159735 [Dreissena polymorpha]|uniref:Uncharacterized protein n=1 Tax=Dreissena polymorpha TaxID=45954 RepID=A0A9D4EM66_DREPO|nr:hypothetical protein DPMN_159735 [Dreissena polymorpha]